MVVLQFHSRWPPLSILWQVDEFPVQFHVWLTSRRVNTCAERRRSLVDERHEACVEESVKIFSQE